jgi:type IV pilus assembly protein PilY1
MALPIADGGLNLVFDESNEFAQLVRYMNDANFGDGTWPNIAEIDGEQNLISYFIMDSANSTQDEWADAGGTGQAIELGENPDVVVETINNIFKSILSVSTTFVAPSVPVNVFNRAQTVDEVFLALFEAEVTPLWSGNLKKIKIGTRDTVDGNGNAITVTELQDANGDQAIDVDGRLRRDALTFWTDAGTLPDPPLEEDEVVDKDGRAIKRGAAGQQIAGVAAGNPELTNATAGARQLYTEDIGNTAGITGDTDNSDQLMPLDATVEVATEVWQELAIDSGLSAAADYASATNDEQDEAIDNLEFARGLQDDGATPRDWMMADPLHSRPRTINYGIRTAGYNMDNPDIRIVIGTNEGYMRMFRNTTTGVPDPDTLNVQDGSETWAFMPRAAMPLLDRLHDLTVTDPKHPNSTDGAPVVLTNDVNNDGNLKSGDGDTAWVFFGMRRGGRNLYALDVSDPDTPKLKWVIEGGTTAGFDELSQTFSTPQLGKVRVSGTTIDVLIFGGGYNGDEDGDGDYATCAAIVSAPQRAACFELLGNDRKNRLTRYNRNLVAPAVPVVPIETDADDTDVAFLGDDDVGNAVFIVNADTGALVWKVRGEPANDTDVAYNSGTKTIVQGDMDASIPAEVAAVDTRGDTFIDRIYVGDTAGVVWRIDLRGLKDTNGDGTGDTFVIDEPNLWQVTKLFNGGRRDGADDIVQDRRFFNRVDVSQTRDSSGAYDAVIIGSGDREDPQGEEAENWFYVIKDRATTSGAPASTMLVHSDTDGDGTVEDLADLSSNCLQTDTEANCLNTATLQAQFRNGWRIKLPNSGEKNLAAALTVGGEVFFTTFTPEEPASVCGLSEGSGRFYALSLQDATAIRNFDTTNDGGGETFERSDTLGSGGIPVEVVPLGGGQILVQGQEVGENIVQAGVASGFRTYWHELPEL